LPEQPQARKKDTLLLLGLYVLIFCLLLSPFFPLAFYLLPFPLFLLVITNQLPYAILIAIIFGGVAVFSDALITGFIQLLAFAVALGMGSVYRKEGSTGVDVVLTGLIISFITTLLFMVLAYLYIPAFQEFFTLWDKEVANTRVYLEQMGVTNLDPSAFRLNLFLPLFLFLTLSPLSLITHGLGGKWLAKRNIPVKKLPPFKNWRLPRVFFHFYLVFMLVYFFTIAMDSHSLDNYLGILYILHVLFVIQGISLIAFLLDVWKKKKGWLLLFIFLLITPLSTLVQMAGVLDTGFKIREWIVKSKGQQ
jgi:uncharacterized protein YybS (DUF2232 family)